MPRILAIESTCDETAAAVVEDGWRVLSNVVATQIDLHAKYRGVVPEIACRAHIENILPVIQEAIAHGQVAPATGSGVSQPMAPEVGLTESRASASDSSFILPPSSFDFDAVAVAHRPGLVGSLLIGVTAAKTLAWSLGKPLIGVDHVHAHLYSVVLEKNEHPPMPAIGLVCSGGHTALYLVKSWTDVTLIGSTIDDAVGEAYDKVAAILGLGYPGGPHIDRLAATGDPKAIAFPRPLLGPGSLDFSFSGLKTAVLYAVRGVPTKDGPHIRDERHQPPAPTGQRLADVCASFQQACVDVIVKKLKRAAEKYGAKSILIGGGVSANRGLRAALQGGGTASTSGGTVVSPVLRLPVYFPPLKYCTDNAAMSGGLAHVYFEQRRFSELSLDAITFSQFAR
ncbi:tRNA (adenosine(37)-N6)-threonylcarbamoyltransferase complex transferase subunit TsaD [Humisphaera borealis]|uniref:tRNA N6-adenosine threonylcarbamoyltransferase n=1 Tax=Humisphaera borealis TaxID=2807512 RepID=A0A7M2WYN3_9BACT|nr:tRNA (adenosine(37)-N6)-threonylcarbamoyltransferase complex transferase subunit TsaD [Humisphaera borealis]QOV89951.1 tRNA (adenosine(37)-N6)-threonylcarbamoyltransferase complex transferase subunit TsaD [Humisphaera borealis]